MPRHVLGISAFYHDSAACLVRDGEIVAAAQEERFTRVKGDARFPAEAARFCLDAAGIDVRALEAVAFYDKPLLKFERLLETYLSIAPRGFRSWLAAGPTWAVDKLFQERSIRAGLDGWDGPILWAEHHESHAASAFYPSPFDEAAVLTLDGVGEWATASIGVGRGASLRLLTELRWPDSLGLLYSAVTQHLGFRVNSGEYKVMGLAPYGRPRYVDALLGEVVDLRDDGSFTLDQRWFDYLGGLTMTSRRFAARFGPARAPDEPLEARHLDLARSVQVVCEEIVLRMARTAHARTNLDALCLAGGVALNAVANGRIAREGPFRHVWIQPAAGDAGGALGAALLAWHRHFGAPRTVARDATGAPHDAMRGALLGPSFDRAALVRACDALGAVHTEPPDDRTLLDAVAALLADGAVVGWFDGRMEYGPRALGSRSILADPRRAAMQQTLNQKIKFREGFRPFAPMVAAERARDWFELPPAAGDRNPSPYMLLVVPVAESRRAPAPPDDADRPMGERLRVVRSAIPAVTHVDGSARVQTVRADTHPRVHALLAAFERRTDCPVLVNTSFNVRGEPVVCTPEDAYRCFMATDMDALVLGPLLLHKRAQPGHDDPARWRTAWLPD